jgi:hypothetical protein
MRHNYYCPRKCKDSTRLATRASAPASSDRGDAACGHGTATLNAPAAVSVPDRSKTRNALVGRG